MDDGTIMAAVYKEPVHYLEDNEYKEIDGSLSEDTEDGEEVLSTSDGVLPVKFANKAGKKLLTIGKGNDKIKVSLADANKVKSEILEQEATPEIELDEKLKVITKSRIIYRDILKNTDIVYIGGSESLKENIILKNTEVPESYTFEYTGKDIDYKKLEDGTVELYLNKSDEKSYSIDAPFMVDAEGKYSNDVEVDIKKKNKTITITLTPSKDFLEAEDTVYPVTIDPPIETPKDYSAIQDTFVRSNYPDDNSVRSYGSLLVGKNTSYGTCYAYIKFNSLPNLSAGDVIVKAYFSIWQYNFSTLGQQEFCIEAYELQSDWTEAVTWNTRPQQGEGVDYMFVGPCSDNQGNLYYYEKALDITRLVRDWYSGKNYGVMLASTEDIYADARFFTADYPFGTSGAREGSSEQYPSGIFVYRNTNGLEDYWSYHTASTSQGTTGYVNDATGALSMTNVDMSSNGNIMPFTFTRTYNMNNYWLEPSQGIRSGIGWTTNLNQYLYWTTLGGIPYCVYTDADGTAHYIRDTGNGWYDEDGLGLWLNFYMNDYSITDKNGDCVRFTNVNGKIYPYMIQENGGNKIDIHYDSGNYNQPDRITDGAGREIKLSYNNNGRLSAVTDPSGRITTYTYDGNGEFLGRITYPDGQCTVFSYILGVPDKLITVWDTDGSGIRYQTNSNCKVTSVEEIATNSSTKTLYNVIYPAINVMRYTYPNGLSEDYQSDNYGRVTSVTNSEGYGSYTGFITNDSSVKRNNKNTFTSNVQKSVANLLLNGCAEGGEAFWDHEGWGNYSGVSATRSNDAKLGNYSWQITKESLEGSYHKRSYFSVEKGKTYTLSGYIKTNLVCDNESGGAKIYVVYFDNAGNQCKVYSEPITNTQNEWERVSITFTNMQWTETIYVFAGITDGASGTALFDCIQLEEGHTANRYNALENGSFEREFANSIASGTISAVTGTSPVGGSNKAIKIVGNPKGNAFVRVDLSLNVPANTNVVVSAYGKATAAPMDISKDTYTNGQLTSNPRLFGIELTAHYTDGTNYKQAMKFNDDLSSASWQYLSSAFNLSYQGNKDCGKTVDYVSVTAAYYGQINEAQFDLLALYVEEFGTEYAYDDNGNLISAADAAQQNNTYTYGDNNLKQLISPTGSNYEYGYNLNKNVTDSTSAEGIRNIIKYDNFGNPTYTLTQGETRNESLNIEDVYYIKNAQTGKYLEVLNNGVAVGNAVGQNSLHQTPHQMWTLKKNNDGTYKLSPKCAPTLYLATSSSSTNFGTGAIINTSSETSTSFQIERTSLGMYNLRMKSSANQVLEVADSYANDNRQVTVGTLDNGEGGALDQQWYFEKIHADDEANPSVDYHSEEPLDGGIYYIKSVHNGRYLENNTTTQTIGQNIFTGEIGQKFLITQNETGYKIVPVKRTEADVEQIYNLTSVGNGSYQITSATDESQYFRLPDGATTYENATPIHAANTNSALSWWIFEKAGSYMESSAEYTPNGNYLSKVTAADGTSVSYAYDSNKGTLNNVTEPSAVTENNTVVTNYEYHPNNDLLTKVTQGNSQVFYVYNNRKLQEITSPVGTKYLFTYNAFNQRESTKIGNTTLATNTYDNMGRLAKTEYGNGHSVENVYDLLSRITSVKYNDIEKVSYIYDNDSNVSSMTDGFSGITTKYAYDSIKRLTSMITSTGFRLSLSYDDKNRVSKMNESISGTGITDKQTEYNYNNTGIIEQVKTTQNNTALTTTYQFDDLYRMHISSLKLKVGETEQEVLQNTYHYREGELAGSTTNYVKQHIINDRIYDYTYDVRGNITQISLNGNVVATYTYDEFDQLISETKNGVTTTWTYDVGGNILTKSSGETIIEYTYGDAEWKDKLTNYNGKSITYDKIGNPLTIGTDTTLTWEAGRRLASITKADVTTSFIYNADGYRTSKTSGGVTTTYHLDGSRITAMIKGTDELSFAYDENGAVIGLYHNGIAYAYAKNLQGDIIGIIDGNGNWMVTYEYDAWGNPIATEGTLKDTLGSLNPFRYRGYVYDVETGFYYVSSRYYDAEIGRFVNADNAISGTGESVQGYNLYSYCFNNPVNMSDPNGNWPKWVSNIGNAVKTVVSTVINKVKSAAASVKTTILNAAKGNSNSLPTKGEPGSSQTLKNPDGTPKQKRWYGPDGKAERDRDYNHQGGVPFPHDHTWNNGKRGKDHLAPSPLYEFSVKPVVGLALASACTISIFAVVADDLTGIGVADNFLIGPLGTGVSKGLIMMFP